MADKYTRVELSAEQVAVEREVFGGLAQSVRELAEASLRTTIDADEARQITAQIRELDAQLRARMIPDSLGMQVNSDLGIRAFGNAVVGMRNPIAPPLTIERTSEGRAWSTFHLNALYEGPPGLVHGGVSALVLDQIMGEAAAAGGSPGMTGTLSLRYRKPTPLGDLRAEAWIDNATGYKTVVKATLGPLDEEPSIEAEGLFILPRWARAEPPSQFE